MRAGIAALLGAYVLSQFYRAFLAVLTPVLGQDLGASASDLAAASGLWFLAFALMQIPVGEALDRVGPRLTTATLMGIGAAGAAIFATASGPGAIKLAMVLIGVGCSSVLMASYYIFARSYAPAVFGTLAGATVGIGNLGNIGSSLPLSMAVEAFGWRASLWGLAAVTALIALAILLLLRDPPRSAGGQKGNLLDLLKMPALWPMLVMMAVCYAPAASIRGLWVGPLFRDVFGADAAWIGQVSLIMGLAMVAGSFAYGPLERALGTRKWLIFGGNAIALACIIGLWLSPQSPALTIALLAGLGFAGASFPMVIAHGRAFIPAHLTGRGVTLLNLFGIAPVGLLQLATGRIHASTPPDPASAPYAAIFGFIALLLAAGLVIYAFSQDRTD
ncbi:MFS transporter [Pseudotabrizicola algicola]|uniref:MFS transporter n=1 Tax=Pseudotabrizicola algicola TaxID=2709381 RepID=A0A6B3RLB6_9RHOB|nr:MFS transporter [Pseudotabrizicola algicola]NEX46840.1 MFS transporter [Pseudotabrizicola algicola]